MALNPEQLSSQSRVVSNYWGRNPASAPDPAQIEALYKSGDITFTVDAEGNLDPYSLAAKTSKGADFLSTNTNMNKVHGYMSGTNDPAILDLIQKGYLLGLTKDEIKAGGLAKFGYNLTPQQQQALTQATETEGQASADFNKQSAYDMKKAGWLGAGTVLTAGLASNALMASQGAGASTALTGMDAGLAGIPEGVIGGGTTAGTVGGGGLTLDGFTGSNVADGGMTLNGFTGSNVADGLSTLTYGAEGLGGTSAIAQAAGELTAKGITGNALIDRLIKSFGPFLVGAWASKQQGDKQNDIANMYKPGLERFNASFAPGFDLMKADPALQTGLDSTMSAALRKGAVGGLQPSGVQGAMNATYGNYVLPALGAYRNSNLGLAAGYGGAANTANQSDTNMWNSLGAGLSNFLNPPTKLEDTLASLKKSGLNMNWSPT